MNWIVIILCLLLFPIVVSKPRQRFEILPTEDIEGIEGLLNLEELNSYNLHQYIGKIDGPSSTWMEFLAKYGLIENSRVCEYCPTPMSLIKETDLKAENYIWRCAGCKKDKSSTKVTVKSGSFFEGLHLSVQQVLYAAADWLENPSKKISDVSRDLKIDKNTIVKLHEWFRQMTKQWFYREASRDPNMKLGGPNKVVEIDETLMFRAKYNRGRMLTRRQVWVFGMIERGTSKVIMFRVPKRDSSTLLPIIHKYVRPGTTIVSDGWAAYGGINRMQSAYNHKFVNHKTNFVDPSDRRVHTQSIEATWGVLKRKLKSRFGDPDHRLDGHMFTYMFRRFHEDTMLLNHLIYEMKFFRRDQLPHTDGDFDLDSSDDSGDSSEDDENDISEDDSSEELSDVEDMDDFDEGDSESDHSSDEEELQNQQRWLSDEDEMEFVHRLGPDIVNDIDLHGEIMSLARRAGRELSPTSRSSSPPARSGRLSEYDHVPPTRNGLSGLSESPQRGRGAHAQRRGHGRRAVRTAATAAATTEATRPSPRRSPVLNRQGRGTHAHRRGRGRRVVRAGSPKSPTTSEEPATTPSPTHSPVLNRQGRGTHAHRRGRGRRVVRAGSPKSPTTSEEPATTPSPTHSPVLNRQGRGTHAHRRGRGRRVVRAGSPKSPTTSEEPATTPSPTHSPVLNRQGRGTHAHRRGRGRRVVRAGSPKSPTTSEEPATTPSPTHSPVLNRQGRGTHAQRRGRGRRVVRADSPTSPTTTKAISSPRSPSNKRGRRGRRH